MSDPYRVIRLDGWRKPDGSPEPRYFGSVSTGFHKERSLAWRFGSKDPAHVTASALRVALSSTTTQGRIVVRLKPRQKRRRPRLERRRRATAEGGNVASGATVRLDRSAP